MSDQPAFVAVVDDDQSVRESLPVFLSVCGFSSKAFASAEDFLATGELEATRCLILDIAMPGMTGPELGRELQRRQRRVPIVYITALDDESVRPRLLASGAVACLFKPFSEAALLDALARALRER